MKSEKKLGFFKLGIGESSSKERMDYMSVLVAGRRRAKGYDKQMAVSLYQTQFFYTLAGRYFFPGNPLLWKRQKKTYIILSIVYFSKMKTFFSSNPAVINICHVMNGYNKTIVNSISLQAS